MRKIISSLLLMMASSVALAQADLMSMLEQEKQDERTFATATFKGSRLINGHTIESKKRGELEFIFAHRFGQINDGIHELFGLDQAYVRIGLEYGISDRLAAGFGRNSVDKTMDGYLKMKLLRQQTGSSASPVTVSVMTASAIRTTPRKSDATYDITLEDRVSYTNQILIARKFSPTLSMQLMPTFIHRNTVEQDYEENKLFALGIGGRMKITRSLALSSEYYYRVNPNPKSPYHDIFGIGLDIETGGHIFQLVLTNTRGLTERSYITETTGDFTKGDIHFGFNVTRTFQARKNKG